MGMPESFASAFLFTLAFASANTLGSVFFFQGVERRRVAESRLYDLPIPPGQLRRERLGSALFVLAFALASGGLLAGSAIHTTGPGWSWGDAAITFLGCFLSFDVYYFFFHRAMHGRLRPIHEWHHASRVNSPWTALSLSPLETLGWLVGLSLWPVLASPFFPIVPEALLVWLLFFWWTNTMGHINVEIAPEIVSRTRIGRMLSHPILYHALHHARFSRHYCFALNGLDTWFGSVWPDYPALHRKVLGGDPLRSLSERGPGASEAD
jgi:sterol desaturase/sphingolipid hydroxylase (fatty acid hydroxylase superfamily)